MFPWAVSKFPDFCLVWNLTDFSLTAKYSAALLVLLTLVVLILLDNFNDLFLQVADALVTLGTRITAAMVLALP